MVRDIGKKNCYQFSTNLYVLYFKIFTFNYVFTVYKTNSLLFKQTQEDRQKRITEKVAMILIDCDTDTLSSKTSLNDCPNIKLRSKYLNKIRNVVSYYY